MNKIFSFFALLITTSALGQYETNLTLQKNSFLIGEPVLATITITNRAGTDVILGGVGSRPWLQFQFADTEGRVLPAVSLSSKDPIKLKAGGTTRHTAEIEGNASTSTLGTFYTTASIYHPLSAQYYITNRSRITVTDGKPMFDKTFGVPAGYQQPGRARRYQLIIFRDVDAIQFYSRLVDDRTKDNLITQFLGPITTSLQPQAEIDIKNRLQVLFMAQQHVFCHTIINPDGKIAKRDYYMDDDGANRPTLVLTKSGATIVGGRFFDPNKPPEPNKGIRKASERPKGL